MIRNFIDAARLRTLPLSISGIIVGSFLAASQEQFNGLICFLALLTTIEFQILSNFANDYGDGVKGTDNDDRRGPERAIQSGLISPKMMLNAIRINIGINLLTACILIYVAFGKDDFLNLLIFFVLGLASIFAALKYTMGKKAYGYNGLGDLFVFIFFGLVSVCGSYYLFTKDVNFSVFLPAITIGFLSMGVLNLNNMRDRASDKIAGKRTLVVKIGPEFAKYYHYYLLFASLLFSLLFVVINFKSPTQFLFLIAYIPIALHGLRVYRNIHPELLDPELKKLALSTFLYAILFGIGLIL